MEAKDKVAVITGASSGIGRQSALVLLEAGYSVVLAGRRAELLDSAIAEAGAPAGKALSVTTDVSDPDSIKNLFARTVETFGRLDLLFNNAGQFSPRDPLEDLTIEQWTTVVNVNLNGVWRMAQEVAKHMVRLGHGGSIINIASMLGLAAVPYIPAYCASKAAVVNLTRALAVELAKHDIRVNAIAPGYFESEMTHEFLGSAEGRTMIGQIPQRRSGNPAELDGALLLLASDASSYMTGSVLTVDGGHTLVIPSR